VIRSQAKLSWLMPPKRWLTYSGEVALFRRAVGSL